MTTRSLNRCLKNLFKRKLGTDSQRGTFQWTWLSHSISNRFWLQIAVFPLGRRNSSPNQLNQLIKPAHPGKLIRANWPVQLSKFVMHQLGLISSALIANRRLEDCKEHVRWTGGWTPHRLASMVGFKCVVAFSATEETGRPNFFTLKSFRRAFHLNDFQLKVFDGRLLTGGFQLETFDWRRLLNARGEPMAMFGKLGKTRLHILSHLPRRRNASNWNLVRTKALVNNLKRIAFKLQKPKWEF